LHFFKIIRQDIVQIAEKTKHKLGEDARFRNKWPVCTNGMGDV
jgi:hypothetical protein